LNMNEKNKIYKFTIQWASDSLEERWLKWNVTVGNK
jgi:hypothetical protein